MKLNDFRKLLKVNLNKCNIILIILLLFVVLTYTSIVPYITNLLNLKKEQEIEEFRRKSSNKCVIGKPARNFNYVMGSHFGNGVNMVGRPEKMSYYTGRGLPLHKRGSARSIINKYSDKATNNKYKNFSPTYMKKNFTKENRQLLCNNYSKWKKDMRSGYYFKPPRQQPGIRRRQLSGRDAKAASMNFNKDVMRPCLWDLTKKPRTKDIKRIGLRDVANRGKGYAKINSAFNMCTDINNIKDHPLNEKYSKWYSNDNWRRKYFDKLRYDKSANKLKL